MEVLHGIEQAIEPAVVVEGIGRGTGSFIGIVALLALRLPLILRRDSLSEYAVPKRAISTFTSMIRAKKFQK